MARVASASGRPVNAIDIRLFGALHMAADVGVLKQGHDKCVPRPKKRRNAPEARKYDPIHCVGCVAESTLIHHRHGGVAVAEMVAAKRPWNCEIHQHRMHSLDCSRKQQTSDDNLRPSEPGQGAGVGPAGKDQCNGSCGQKGQKNHCAEAHVTIAKQSGHQAPINCRRKTSATIIWWIRARKMETAPQERLVRPKTLGSSDLSVHTI